MRGSRDHLSLFPLTAFLSVTLRCLVAVLVLLPTHTVLAQDRPQDGQSVTIDRVELHGDTLYPHYGLTQAFIDKRVAQLSNRIGRAMTLSDMRRLADAITLMYREKGLTFHKAYIPPQAMENGTLRIDVLAGVLAEVDIRDNDLYTREQLLVPFEPLIGKPLYEPAVKDAVARLKAMPGLNVFSYFSVGAQRGESRLNIKVTGETAHRSSLTVDNHGVDQTGQNRLLFSHLRNNPFRQSGTLSVALLATDEKDNLFGGLTYRAPITATQSLGASVLHSEFAVADQFSTLGLEGELTAASLFWSRQHRDAGLMRGQEVTLSSKTAEVNSDLFGGVLDNRVDYSQISGRYQLGYRGDGARALSHHLSLGPGFGHIHHADNIELPDTFWTLQARYRLLVPVILDESKVRQHSELRLRGQWTDRTLPSAERFVATGAYANRGFEPGIFSGDWGGTLSLEHTLRIQSALWGNDNPIDLQPFAFVDASAAGLNEQDVESYFTSAGLGLRSRRSFSTTAGDSGWSRLWIDEASVTVTAGYPIDYDLDEAAQELDEGFTLYGALTLRF